MRKSRALEIPAIVFLLAALLSPSMRGAAQSSSTLAPALFAELRWRHIGPFRGGPTPAAAGVPSQPGLFYAGAADGGVWKTTDYGRTWAPIFDGQPTGSIGAIAVAPSDPSVIYVGTGAGLRRPGLATGDGLFKSADAGRTWTQLGLRDARQIAQIAVDARNPNRLFVAALGHPYGPNDQRGVYRSLDGGKSFERVLHRDEDTGALDIAIDPSNPDVVYAVLWQSRQAPWDAGVFSGEGSGLLKSLNGGATWRRVGGGLPSFEGGGLGRIAIAIAPSTASRIYATVEARHGAGLYRSDDAGETFTVAGGGVRVTAGNEPGFAAVAVDPKNPEVAYTAGGYHRLWIDPANSNVMLAAGDRGAIVTVNGGRTWSSSLNQPTAVFHHVRTDNAFPYRVCGGGPESGSACVQSRSDRGRIGMREWTQVGAGAGGFVAPDPADADVVYDGAVARFDRRTQQSQPVGPPRGAGHRAARDAPLVFSPIDGKTLFFAASTIWKTTTGGQTWTEISRDLSRETWEAPPNIGVYRTLDAARPVRRGVVSTVAPSYVDARTIWAGTDDGLIHVTRDAGMTWTDVTPPMVGPWAKVSLIEPSHFDANGAYAAVDTSGLDDLRPHVYRTRNGGTTWTEIVAGVPDGGVVHAVREDPQRRGLLFAGTSQAVYVSFDDGDVWQPLRLNLPATSIRDLTIKEADLVAATGGRGFWILDDITPLRQLTPDVARADAFLFRPATAWRTRSNAPTAALLADGDPAAPNPPDGVVVSYLLGAGGTGSVTLEIIDTASGETIRRYSSEDSTEPRLSTAPGLHRFVWDVRWTPPPLDSGLAPTPLPGAFALPGTYQLRLTAGGRLLRQPIVVRLDPRVRTPAADLALQLKLSRAVDEAIRRLAAARDEASRRGDTAATGRLQDALAPLPGLFRDLQQADARPTATMEAAVAEALKKANEAVR